MERLTSREPRVSRLPGVCCTHFGGGDCQAVQGNCADGCLWEEAAWDRLAAYEVTGLTPEEIENFLKKWCYTVERGVFTPPPNTPLTLEELREMDGEPVWVISQDGQNESCWMLVDVEYELCREAHGGMAVFENNGKTWMAYRRRPGEDGNGMKWISVKDRLPKEEQDVLLYVEIIETYGKHRERKKVYHNIFYGYCDYGEWLTSYCHGCEYIYKMNEKFPNEHIEVTHWMPLPEPPEEGTT